MNNVLASTAGLVRWPVADNSFIAMKNGFWRIGRIGQRHDFTLDAAGDCFVFSNHDGLIEPTVDLGSFVDEGDVLARVCSLDRTGINPIEYWARRQGMLAGRHFPGLVKAGDFMAVIAINDE